jgi:ElaB/YqjD/DUF883 family membrane-anchored ribosome-binding protein
MPHDPVSIHAASENSAALATGVAAMTDEAKNQLQDAAKMIQTIVTNRPALALGAALTAGVLLGCLIKRR